MVVDGGRSERHVKAWAMTFGGVRNAPLQFHPKAAETHVRKEVPGNYTRAILPS